MQAFSYASKLLVVAVALAALPSTSKAQNKQAQARAYIEALASTADSTANDFCLAGAVMSGTKKSFDSHPEASDVVRYGTSKQLISMVLPMTTKSLENHRTSFELV